MIKKFIYKYLLPEDHDDSFMWMFFFVFPCGLIAFDADSKVDILIICLAYAVNIAVHFLIKQSSTATVLLVGYATVIGSCLVAYSRSGDWKCFLFPFAVLVFYVLLIIFWGGLRELRK